MRETSSTPAAEPLLAESVPTQLSAGADADGVRRHILTKLMAVPASRSRDFAGADRSGSDPTPMSLYPF
jgi:hypothetical protein